MKKRINIVTNSLLLFVFSASLFAQIPAEDIEKIKSAFPAKATVQNQSPRKILVFTRTEGYRHKSIPHGVQMVKMLGEITGAFSIEHSEDYQVFAKDNLQKFDAVFFLNPTGINLGGQKFGENLLQFVKDGKGFIGIHSATDNFDKWPEAAEMIGGRFAGHPWNSSGTWAVKLDESEHPLCAAFEGNGFKINDEIYRIDKPFSREKSRVLLSLEMDDKVTAGAKGIRHSDIDMPIAWVRTFGKGRVFYSSFGHNNHIYWNEKLIRHFLAGIQYALGDLPADDFPSVEKCLATVATYKYGQDRSHLTELNRFIRVSAGDKAALLRLEKQFIELLKNKNTPLAAQQYICDRLSMMGTNASVKILAKLLQEKEASEFARFALERIPGEKSSEALRKSVKKLHDDSQIGMITSLGIRRDEKAVNLLSKFVLGKDEKVATAAARALGEIGSNLAIGSLTNAKTKTKNPVRANIVDALLNAADRQLQNGNKSTAAAIYRSLNAEGETRSIRSAAARGSILAASGNEAELLIKILNDDDPSLHKAAFSAIRSLPAQTDLQAVVEVLKKSPDAVKIPLLASLAFHKQPAITAAAMGYAEHENPAVKKAALLALQKVGVPSSVELLANEISLNNSFSADAKSSLYLMRGEDIDQAVLAAIPMAEAKIKVELLKSVVERGIRESGAVVLAAMEDENPRVRLQAARVLQVVGQPEILPQLIALLQKSEIQSVRSALEKTVIAVAKRSQNSEQTNDLLLQALQSAESTNSAAALMKTIAELGQEKSLPVLTGYLGSNNSDLGSAAIQALGVWPDSQPASSLFKIANSKKKSSHQILALRSYAQLKSRENPALVQGLETDFSRAMNLAANLNEQKRVLAALANVPSIGALKLAQSYTNNLEMKTDAEFAMVTISERALAENPPFIAKKLTHLSAETGNEAVREKAAKILKTIKGLDHHIIKWQVKGPFVNDKVDIFLHPFQPETSAASDSGWQTIPALTDDEDPWRIDIRDFIGGANRVAYLRTAIDVAEGKKYRLEMGSDDGVRAWINGELVHSNNIKRGVNPGSDVVEIKLEKGRNTILLKINQGGGGWGACTRILNLDGSKVDNLNVVPW